MATVGVDGGQNAGILTVQMLAIGNDELLKQIQEFKENLKLKILKANEELKEHKFKYRA
jgi:5-(carboxyamino)imidazole ribonucleotide mutase